MALDPNDLLIFKVRDEDTEESKKKEVKKPQPATTQPQTQQQQPVEQPVKKQANYEPFSSQTPAYSTLGEGQPIPELENSPAPAEIVDAALNAGYSGNVKQQPKRRRELNPRKLAQHMSCELHPWRRAYAICNHCNRAFCYEDIVESGGKYYCLDDIDKVPELSRRSQFIRYNNLGLISSILFMLVFFTIVYYSYPQVILMFSTLMKLGYGFITKTIASNIILLASLFLAVISLLAAIMILLNSSNSFKMSAIAGLLTVGLFSYQYLNVEKVYLLGVAILSFIAMITLTYSRVSYDSLPDGDQLFDGDSQSIGVARSSF